jgi:ppGpp synthetase/RelA/SpoT-type nucleotidyltranferase
MPLAQMPGRKRRRPLPLLVAAGFGLGLGGGLVARSSASGVVVAFVGVGGGACGDFSVGVLGGAPRLCGRLRGRLREQQQEEEQQDQEFYQQQQQQQPPPQVAEVVLGNWLDEGVSPSARREDLSTMSRVQAQLERSWEVVDEGGRLTYLGEDGVERVKAAMVMLTAYEALRSRPGQGVESDPLSVLASMDSNNDGYVSMEEFREWLEGEGEGQRATEEPVEDMIGELPQGHSLLRSLPVIVNPGPHDERERRREMWLAGGGEGEVGKQPHGGQQGALERSMTLIKILAGARADADTLVACMASDVMKMSSGAMDMDSISHFGPVVAAIARDRARLEQLPGVTHSSSLSTLRSSAAYNRGSPVSVPRPVLDLDDYHAKLLREYMVQASNDIRAVVIHMGHVLQQLRKSSGPESHHLALEALQLYVPISNALGLGQAFGEMEELGYRSLFPRAYSEFSVWHESAAVNGRGLIKEVKGELLRALENHPSLPKHVKDYEIKGRIKSKVSTFRKVFRKVRPLQNVHDVLGLRVIVHPRKEARRKHKGRVEDDEDWMAGDVGDRIGESGEEVLYTKRTYPPPYRDPDSHLLDKVLSVILSLWDADPSTYKNYVDFPKANGYKSLHIVVQHPTGALIELQIRTAHMHHWAETGAASHSLYKGDLGDPVAAGEFTSRLKAQPQPVSSFLLPGSVEDEERAGAASAHPTHVE